MSKAVKITVIQLIGLLASHWGTTFLSFIAETTPTSFRLRATDGSGKVNPYYKQLVKRAKVNVMTDFDYARRIEKVRSEQGLEMRDIGPARMEKIQGAPICRSSTGHLCLWCEVRHITDKTFIHAPTGKIVDESKLEPFKPVNKTEINYCTYGLENIRQVTINGNTYEVDSSTYTEAEYAIAARFPTKGESLVPVHSMPVLTDTTQLVR